MIEQTSLEYILKKIRESPTVKNIKGFKPSGVKMDTPLNSKDSTGLDSLGRVEMLLALEEIFHMSISDEEVDTLTTFGDVAKLIRLRAANT